MNQEIQMQDQTTEQDAPRQLTRADMKHMSPEEISAAYSRGQFAELLDPNTES